MVSAWKISETFSLLKLSRLKVHQTFDLAKKPRLTLVFVISSLL